MPLGARAGSDSVSSTPSDPSIACVPDARDPSCVTPISGGIRCIRKKKWRSSWVILVRGLALDAANGGLFALVRDKLAAILKAGAQRIEVVAVRRGYRLRPSRSGSPKADGRPSDGRLSHSRGVSICLAPHQATRNGTTIDGSLSALTMPITCAPHAMIAWRRSSRYS